MKKFNNRYDEHQESRQRQQVRRQNRQFKECLQNVGVVREQSEEGQHFSKQLKKLASY